MKTSSSPSPEAAFRRSFAAFLHRSYLHLNPGGVYLDNWHIDAIIHRLDGAGKGGGARLIFTLPPRSLKSITVSVAWAAYMLGKNPSLKIVCVSYSAELATKLARDCRNIMRSSWYRRTFPGTVLDRSAEHDLTTTKGGGRFSTSVGGTLTGRGGDTIIIDDPIKPESAMSQAERQTVIDWYRSTLSSRLDNKSKGDIIVVMQRVHEGDLAGHLLEAGGFDHLTLPAIAIDEERIPLSGGRSHLRHEGEPLHPEREPLAILHNQKSSMGDALFGAQYQQTPAPAGGVLFKPEWLARYEKEPDLTGGGDIVQSWDCASKEGVLNDYSVCVTAWVFRRRTYILDVQRARMDFPTLKRRAIELAERWRANIILIEDAASGMALIQELRAQNHAGVPSPKAVQSNGDKVSRASGVTAAMESGDVLFPKDTPWLGEFERELLTFPQSKHDDQVDALVQLLSWVRNRHENGVSVAPEAVMPVSESWRPPPSQDYWDMVDGMSEDADDEEFEGGIMFAKMRPNSKK